MCENCKSTDEAQARRAELEAAATACQQHHTPENRERLLKANRAVWNIHNDYIFDQARQRIEELRAQGGVQAPYIVHVDEQPVYQAGTKKSTLNLSMQRIVARAPWGDTYSAQDAEDGCVPSEASFVEGVEG
jgi:hypothetical protein